MQADVEKQRVRAFQAACSAGSLEVIQILRCQSSIMEGAFALGLGAAAQAGQTAAISLLLEATQASGELDFEGALVAAISAGQSSAVLRLLADQRVSISERVFEAAIRSGHIEVLDRLLTDARSDEPLHPWQEFDGVAEAIHAKNDDALELMLADPRCLPPYLYCSPLTAAVQRGDAALVARLLAHPCVDPNGPGEGTLLSAAARRPETLNRILEDGRALPASDRLSHVLADAVGAGNEPYVHRVLDLPMQQTSEFGPPRDRYPVDGCYALRAACLAGSVPMVDLLLRHPRVRVDADALAENSQSKRQWNVRWRLAECSSFNGCWPTSGLTRKMRCFRLHALTS